MEAFSTTLLFSCWAHTRITFKSPFSRDIPGGPVIKNLPCNAWDAGLIPGWGTKMPRAAEQLSPTATPGESQVSHDKRSQMMHVRPATANK